MSRDIHDEVLEGTYWWGIPTLCGAEHDADPAPSSLDAQPSLLDGIVSAVLVHGRKGIPELPNHSFRRALAEDGVELAGDFGVEMQFLDKVRIETQTLHPEDQIGLVVLYQVDPAVDQFLDVVIGSGDLLQEERRIHDIGQRV